MEGGQCNTQTLSVCWRCGAREEQSVASLVRFESASVVIRVALRRSCSKVSFFLEGQLLVLLIFVNGQFPPCPCHHWVLFSGVLMNVGQCVKTRGACWSGPFASLSSFRIMFSNRMGFRHSWRTGCAASGQS